MRVFRLVVVLCLLVLLGGCEVAPAAPPVPEVPPVVVVDPPPVVVEDPPAPPPNRPGVSIERATGLLGALAAEYGVTMEAGDPQLAVEKANGLDAYADAADPLLAVVEKEFRPQYDRRSR